jgi:hypothetical protein
VGFNDFIMDDFIQEENDQDVLEALATTSVMLECLSRTCLRFLE